MKTEKEKQVLRDKARRYRNAHPGKKAARKEAEKQPKQPCRDCLKEGVTNMDTEGHHEDYSKPWLLIYLCKKHHEKADTEFERLYGKREDV